MKIVEVHFEDPTTYNHWSDKDTIASSCCRVCIARGSLFEDSERYIKVCLLGSDDGETFSDWVVIPKGCMVDFKEIGDVE